MHTSTAEVAKLYDNVRIGTAPHRKTIYLLHEKAISLIAKAIRFEERRKNHLVGAQNILSQLMAALRVTDEVSQGLMYLYDYCYALLDHDDHLSWENAISILFPLKTTFQQLLVSR